jgi:hypothetical protein
MLSFEEVKKVRIVDVAARYGIRLRFKGEWASAPCPLPTHKAGDKNRNFTINLGQNYWRCFSASCNEKNEGRKGGDVINFVALMENCRERDAAQKLADWYGLLSTSQQSIVNNNKTAPQIETRPRESPKEPSAMDSPDRTAPDKAVKGSGYMHETGVWLDEVLKVVPDGEREKLKKLIAARVYESYKNGKAART